MENSNIMKVTNTKYNIKNSPHYEEQIEVSPGVITTYKYCVDNCKIDGTLNLYFILNQQKCERECDKYYDPTNNECLETCIGRTNLQYSNSITTPNSPPQPCLNKCPNFFIKKKIILIKLSLLNVLMNVL